MAACRKYVGKDFGLLALRLAVGIVMVYHGYLKLGNTAGTMGFFGNLGIPLPTFFAYFVGLVELLGGAMIILGLLTCYAAGLLAINMVVALLVAHTKMPYAAAELPIVLLGGLLALTTIGGGKWSVLKSGCCGGTCEGNCGKEDKDGCGGNCGCSDKAEPMKK